MNVSSIDNRNYLQTDYRSIVKNIAETLPVKDETPTQGDFMEEEGVMSDEKRELLVGYMGYQSKIDQVDIYLRGSTNGKVGYDGVLPDIQTFNDMQNRMKIADVYA